MECFPRSCGPLCIRNMFHSLLVAYSILVICNVILEAPSNIAQEKIQAIQESPFKQHWDTVFIYVYISSFTSKKVMLSLLLKSVKTNAKAAAQHST